MKKISDAEIRNREKLFQLMRQHPELPVVPMVNSDIIQDDYCAYWIASWGPPELGAYIIGDERVYLRDDDSDDMEDVLNHVVGGRDWYEAAEADVERAYNKLQWTEAIIVYIVCPSG